MNLYNAIIIDDEIHVQDALKIMVKQNCPEISVVACAGSAQEGRQLLKKNDVQLIFLDISMPHENGFDFLASIPASEYAIIFTTAHEEYALKAIKANAIDYLLKPIIPNELVEASAKAIAYLNLRKQKVEVQQVYGKSIENLSQQVQNKQEIDKITVVEKFGFRIVEVNSICYLEADSNYTILHLSGLNKIVSSKSLGEFEKVLDPKQFFRIHKSTIINMNCLQGFSSYQGNFAILHDNTKLSVSRRRFVEFREAVNQFSKSVN